MRETAELAGPRAPVRGTQSFVQTLSACWHQPSLTLLEIAWRWFYGIPATALVGFQALHIWNRTPVDTDALTHVTIADPMAGIATLSHVVTQLLPATIDTARWLVPLLAVAWVVVSAVGRGVVLGRLEPTIHRRTMTVILLHALRLTALAAPFALWFASIHAAADATIDRPVLAGQEPNLVGYCALAIVATLGLFTLWAVSSWGLSIAPLLAMRLNLGAGTSLAAAFRVGPLRSKLVEINLVMGIVRIALIVLTMVFSACPLPFEGIATPQFMRWWYLASTVFFLVTSDFFHVVRLASYLDLWKTIGSPPAVSART